MIVIDLPWPPSALSPNQRLHWREVAKVKKKYRSDCHMLTLAACSRKISGRHSLMLEFFPPDGRHRDRDNLLATMKAGIDGVADALGINDREFDPVTVSMATEKGPRVRLTITPYQEAA